MRTRAIIPAILLTITATLGAFVGLVSPRASASSATPRPTPKKTTAPISAQRTIDFFNGEFDGKEVNKTDEEWKKELTPLEFAILRQEATESPYTGALAENHKAGVYYCAACGLAVFSSSAKFESGTGWPSFFETIYKKNVIEREDRSIPEEVRTEVESARCHSHLGHVFDDGPQPTGLRYCMNSASLRFKANK